MKARNEFGSDEEYNAYLRVEFAATLGAGLLANPESHEGAKTATDFMREALEYADALIACLKEAG